MCVAGDIREYGDGDEGGRQVEGRMGGREEGWREEKEWEVSRCPGGLEVRSGWVLKSPLAASFSSSSSSFSSSFSSFTFLSSFSFFVLPSLLPSAVHVHLSFVCNLLFHCSIFFAFPPYSYYIIFLSSYSSLVFVLLQSPPFLSPNLPLPLRYPFTVFLLPSRSSQRSPPRCSTHALLPLHSSPTPPPFPLTSPTLPPSFQSSPSPPPFLHNNSFKFLPSIILPYPSIHPLSNTPPLPLLSTSGTTTPHLRKSHAHSLSSKVDVELIYNGLIRVVSLPLWNIIASPELNVHGETHVLLVTWDRPLNSRVLLMKWNCQACFVLGELWG